uniref:Uncharacterized protein n=1 Tax=Anguilla anguilla TaxID=7936 RepID=A0A0E9XQN0_ANGAN
MCVGPCFTGMSGARSSLSHIMIPPESLPCLTCFNLNDGTMISL